MFLPVFVYHTTSLIHTNRRRGKKVWPAVWKTKTRERYLGSNLDFPFNSSCRLGNITVSFSPTYKMEFLLTFYSSQVYSRDKMR